MITLNGNGVLTGINEEIRSDENKIKQISCHFRKIMEVLGLDMEDDSLKDTPDRVARMYVKEIFSGLNPANNPEITLFSNQYSLRQMIVAKNIPVYSYCEHQFVPIIGNAHVAYYSMGKVIELTKIKSIIQYYCKRPQVQERLTEQIADALKEVLHTQDVAVLIDARIIGEAPGGLNDLNSSTVTSHFSGKFIGEVNRKEFLSFLK